MPLLVPYTLSWRFPPHTSVLLPMHNDVHVPEPVWMSVWLRWFPQKHEFPLSVPAKAKPKSAQCDLHSSVVIFALFASTTDALSCRDVVRSVKQPK